jgi:hypothetical protein
VRTARLLESANIRVASQPERDTRGRIHVRCRLRALCKQVTGPLVSAEPRSVSGRRRTHNLYPAFVAHRRTMVTATAQKIVRLRHARVT